GNVAEMVAAGAEIIVAGTAIFGEADRTQAVRGLRDATLL
ncbi:MAG: ribulose-phosphate 3-epimerase, partial [Pyrinomonadaceae bacterium]|nr:ribulose-phosphate 3-epimerase [Pyrinomonadaceae bacterium]